MDDLHVDDELVAMVVDDQGADAATTRLEGLGQSRPKVGLINDTKGLLDIASLSHGNNYNTLALWRERG
jgi:hypothetical protein